VAKRLSKSICKLLNTPVPEYEFIGSRQFKKEELNKKGEFSAILLPLIRRQYSLGDKENSGEGPESVFLKISVIFLQN